MTVISQQIDIQCRIVKRKFYIPKRKAIAKLDRLEYV